ncbi:hypothetical protein ACOME3_003876 [Neoechinorhynchus agilis]
MPYSSTNDLWNPPPPPELNELADDRIRGTIYSKHRLYQLLLSLVQYCDQCTTMDEIELEETLCSLWDMTINESVSELILNFGAHRVFVHLCTSSISQRIAELCFGILANLLCFDFFLSENGYNEITKVAAEQLRHLENGCSEILWDPLVLVQIMRLCNVLIVGNRDFIEQIPITALVFILKQSLNRSLIAKTCLVVRSMLDNEYKPCRQIYAGLLEAAKTQKRPNRHLLYCLLSVSVQMSCSDLDNQFNEVILLSVKSLLDPQIDLGEDEDSRLEQVEDTLGTIIMTHIELEMNMLNFDNVVKAIIDYKPTCQSSLFKPLLTLSFLNGAEKIKLSKETKVKLKEFLKTLLDKLLF